MGVLLRLKHLRNIKKIT
ncbi:UNVERIFIED_CONTAM: hypothetical protein GTU68_040443 [Idotea baltica]|nr:hypothetical protein [Idotea baltica]